MDINKNSLLWDYVSDPLKDLLNQGRYLINDVLKEGKYDFTDYSFVVFPFAKAYEGFLKQIFLDVKFISHLDYISDHFRLGKVMSPNLVRKLGDRSVYQKICDQAGCELADRIWNTWKLGRNQVFHYFPHNLRSLSFKEAEEISVEILNTMEKTVEKLTPIKSRLNRDKSGLNMEKVKSRLAERLQDGASV